MYTNSSEQLLYHAATQLEAEDIEGCVTTLREAIELATISGRTLELLRARFMLADVLAGTGSTEEAADSYRDVIELGATFEDQSLVEEEIAAARDALVELERPR